MNKKKVVFVQGTAFSGSTLLHMMLANDPSGFACGELHGTFRPFKAYHVNLVCTCGYDQCPIWPNILPFGERFLYAGIFNQLPDVNLVIDSSKVPFWIRSQNENLRRQGIHYNNILIWKTPLEFAHSKMIKNQPNWNRAWVNLHRLYFSYISGIRTVKYQNLVRDPSVLPKVCNFLEIPYFDGKERYWEKMHCVIGGNKRTKAHLYDKDKGEKTLRKTSGIGNDIAYRTIEYSPVTNEELIREVEATIAGDEHFDRLEQMLEYADVSNDDYSPSEFERMVTNVRMPYPEILLRHIKYRCRTIAGRIRFRNTPRFKKTAD
jgi:hypothetical protein